MSESPTTQTEALDYRRFLRIKDGNVPTTSTEIDFSNEFNDERNIPDEIPASPSAIAPKRNLITQKTKTSEKKKKKCDCDNTLKIAIERQEKIRLRLTEEVINLRKEVRSSKTGNKENDFSIGIPNAPFETKAAFLEFEQELQSDETKFDDLKKIFCQGKFLDPKKFVRMNYSKILTDIVAEQFCWRGTAEKGCVRFLSVTSALKHAFHMRYKEAGEDIFDQAAKKYFQYAKDRSNKKKQYDARRSTNPATTCS